MLLGKFNFNLKQLIGDDFIALFEIQTQVSFSDVKVALGHRPEI